MHKVLGLVAAVTLAGCALGGSPDAVAGEVEAGFPAAPPLAVAEWVTGDPIALDDPDKVYVVELWATWCGPCKEFLPKLADVQREYGDRVAVVAISDEQTQTVRAFTARNDYTSEFRVAVDGGVTTGALMRQFKVRGIPATFVVKNGQVLWHGHPAGSDGPISAVVSGKWEPDSLLRLERARAAFPVYLRELQRSPQAAATVRLGERILEDGRADPGLLNEVAWTVLTEIPEPNRPSAAMVAMSKAASEARGHRDHNVLDTYALALFQHGQVAEALAQQRTALELCQQKEPDCSHFAKMVRQYEGAQ